MKQLSRYGLFVILPVLLAVTTTSRAINILPNSSFEYWALGLPVGWLTSELRVPESAVQDSLARTGDWAVKLYAADTAAYVTATGIVLPGREYHFSGWTRTSSLLGGSFALQFRNIIMLPVGNQRIIPVTRSSDYKETARVLTAPDYAVFLSVSLSSLPGATVYLDDVRVEDTTWLAVREEPAPPPAPPGSRFTRRVFATPAAIAAVGPDADIYDASGRRLAGPAQMRPFRVYFIAEP